MHDYKRIFGHLAVAGAITLTAGLSIAGLAATGASAETPGLPIQQPGLALQNLQAGTCLDVVPISVYPFYAVQQSQCTNDPFNAFNQWLSLDVTGTFPNTTSEVRNVGTDSCLQAASWAAGNGGLITLAPCNSSDPYQRWTLKGTYDPSRLILINFQFQNVGTANAGNPTCLDADGGTGGGVGQPIWQWSCSATPSADQFQAWNGF